MECDDSLDMDMRKSKKLRMIPSVSEEAVVPFFHLGNIRE